MAPFLNTRLMMPVTAKLSRRFYEQFGDEIANELVDWFNAVDTAYRYDLRDANEMNFARFDAKLEQRLAEQDAKLEQRLAQQDAKIDHRFSEMDAKIDHRFSQMDAKIERRFAEADAKWEQRFAQTDAKWEQRFAQADSKWEQRFAALRVDLVRWMFALWTGQLIALAAFTWAVLRSR